MAHASTIFQHYCAKNTLQYQAQNIIAQFMTLCRDTRGTYNRPAAGGPHLFGFQVVARGFGLLFHQQGFPALSSSTTGHMQNYENTIPSPNHKHSSHNPHHPHTFLSDPAFSVETAGRSRHRARAVKQTIFV